jgi:hypothetical protein
MDNKEIILSRIAEVLNRPYFLVRNNSEFKARLKCVGLGEYFTQYAEYLVPYSFNNGHTHKFQNDNEEYSVFLGLDCIFSDLYRENKNSEIIALLKELTKSFRVEIIAEEMQSDFEELGNLYELLGLDIRIDHEKVLVSTSMSSNSARVNELFSVESWLKANHREVHDAYESAIDSYTQGHAGACIESCRTCIVSIFAKFRGAEPFAQWMRGIYNMSGESSGASVKDINRALKHELNIHKDDLAEFFNENKAGKLTKTKAIYMMYSMMSDYGTHRNESTSEVPTLEDALFSLRLTDSILFWVYSKHR